ncbi:MAG: DUF5678 domain-containing protein [Candidatus Helarchaeota archaeon]
MEKNYLNIFKIAKDNLEWMNKNSDMIQTKYENKYIAIYNSEIIHSDGDLEKLLEALEKKRVDLNLVKIEFIKPKQVACIL